MRAPDRIAILLLAATILPPAPAIAGMWPSEYYSQTPSVVTGCPAGDMVFGFTLRDYMNPPLRNNFFELALDGCPVVRLAPARGDEGYQVAYPFVSSTTDDGARLQLALRAGGVCANRRLVLHINGALWYRCFASPDQDGNLSVGPEDMALASAKLGARDSTADFDGDGVVTQADLAILSAHLGHQAPDHSTPVASRSWGTLKLLYR